MDIERRNLLKAGIAFFVGGSTVALTPTKIVLQFDQRSGRGIYKQTLNSTGNEERALKDANAFYKSFGFLFALAGTVMGLTALVSPDKIENDNS